MGWIPDWVKRISPLRWPRRIFDSMMEPQDGDSRDALFIFVLVAIALMAAMFVMAVVAQWYGGALGVFGDFFGGVLNPIFSFLTFVGLLITIVMQQKEIREAKATVEKQGFETLFFQMITIHNSIVQSMDLRTLANPAKKIKAKEYHGRDCFARFLIHLKDEVEAAAKKGSSNALYDGYKAFWARDRKDLGHYFRYLFNMIRIVENSTADTEQYVKLLRAQLSDYELVILFYNGGMSASGSAFKKYIHKYALFDNLPDDLLLDIKHTVLYNDDAFFDAKVKREEPKTFLEGWRTSYIDAESRELSELDSVIEEIALDAKHAGITRFKLEQAAGNNLKGYLRDAIRFRNGELGYMEEQ